MCYSHRQVCTRWRDFEKGLSTDLEINCALPSIGTDLAAECLSKSHNFRVKIHRLLEVLHRYPDVIKPDTGIYIFLGGTWLHRNTSYYDACGENYKSTQIGTYFTHRHLLASISFFEQELVWI